MGTATLAALAGCGSGDRDVPGPVGLTTVDSPVYFLRFVALVCAYALVTLALAMAVSALARSRRTGVAAAVLALLVVVLGFDLLVLLGVARGVVGSGTLPLVLGASPPPRSGD